MKDSTVNYQCPTKGNKKGLTGTEVRPQLKNKRKITKLVLYYEKNRTRIFVYNFKFVSDPAYFKKKFHVFTCASISQSLVTVMKINLRLKLRLIEAATSP